MNISYQWYRDGKLIPLATNPRYDTRQPGVYKVRITGPCRLFAESTPITMTSLTAPVLGLRPPDLLRVEESKSFTLTVSVAAGSLPVTYQWAKEGRNITGANGPTYTVDRAFAADAGRYVCVITNACGIVVSGVSDIRVYRNDPTSVSEDNQNGVTAVCEPNPFSTATTLRVGLPTSGNVFVSISDLAGRTVYTLHSTLEAGEHTFALQAADLGAAGVYIVRIEHPAATLVRRIVLAP